MEAKTVKRGRKPKQTEESTAVDIVQDQVPPAATTATPTTPTPQVAKSRRGRKPKAVYNGFDAPTDFFQSNSDDENIIMKLKISQDDDMSMSQIDEDSGFPDAYNEIHANSYSSKPCEIDYLMDKQPCPQDAKVTSGSKLRVIDLLKDFEEKNKNNEWPQTTSICCYWCCHKFDTPPFGIPIKFVDGRFHVFGCFCSLECAAAHNLNSKESIDEIWERHNMLALLSRKIGYKKMIKPAPNRLALKIFGGHLSIDEFRAYCDTSKIININFPPMMTLTQQIEEINESDINNDYKYIPIDTDRINKYKEKIKLKRSKPLTTFENTLDHAMNLKFGS